MFWRLSSSSPVESVLDKDVYSLEELLDEDEIIQECKVLNSRLIAFLRGKAQVQNLLRYIVDEPPENAGSKRAFKFPFIACEIFTCEIDVIFKTLVEDEELMNYLFSFLEPDRPHGTLLAGYFSKVAICLLVRKTIPVLRYLQTHQETLKKLVDLIDITSIMEVLVRLVGADEHIFAFHVDALQWLADTDLLEMLVDKLSPLNSSEVHANAAETLSAVTRIAPSALASKLSSPKFVGCLFHHVLEDPESKSTLVHSLSVCISLLDPQRAATVALAGTARGQHISEAVVSANPETVEGMLQRLGDLLAVLDVSTDDKVLPTTYGHLRPPLGIHRLKIVEFIAVLLRTNSEGARQELVKSGAMQLVLKLFFDYPFNNMLHHHVESIVSSCLDSNSQKLIDHLFQECLFLDKLLAADENPYAPDTQSEPKPAVSKVPTRIGNMGHLTRLANKMIQASSSNSIIQSHLKANPKWSEWVTSVLQPRNSIKNVYHWSCGRPTSVQDRPVDSDEDDFRDRDYDISTMANNLNREVSRYSPFDDYTEEGHGSIGRDDEDTFFDDESPEMIISSLRLGEDQQSGQKDNIFGSDSSWFAFQDDTSRSKEDSNIKYLFSIPSRNDDGLVSNAVSSPSSSGDSSSDDEVVLGEDEDLADTASSASASLNTKIGPNHENGLEMESPTICSPKDNELSSKLERVEMSDNLSLFQQREEDNLPGVGKSHWMTGPRETGPGLEGTSGRDLFGDDNPFEAQLKEAPPASASAYPTDAIFSPPSTYSADFVPVLVISEEHMINPITGEEVAGVEREGTIKAMDKMLKEGVVGEAGPMFTNEIPHENDTKMHADDTPSSESDFNDVNYWRRDYSMSIVDEQ